MLEGQKGMRGAPEPAALVGRDRELTTGLGLLDDSAAGAGSLLLISGEPGIGKSRLAEELARHARDRGFRVVWGRCWEAGGAPAYWPWVQSLRSLLRGAAADDVRAALGDAASVVGQLLPEVRGASPDTQQPGSQDPDAARFELFQSVTTLLTRAAAAQPLMLVLDDLHVADTPSLLLLRYVARVVGDERILAVVTYRDIDPSLGGELAETVSELMRGRAVTRMALRGIAEPDVPRFIEEVPGVRPHDPLAHMVHRETEGNPLFLEEFARVLLDDGTLGSQSLADTPRVQVPRSVRDVIARRLRPLPEESLVVLRLGSVLGREFDIDALAALADRSAAEVLDVLQLPLDGHVITEAPDSRSRMRFGHVVIRECLYEEIGRAQRQVLHRTALGVLEMLYQSDAEAHLSELAHHAYEGAGDGHFDKAIAYAQRAGERALVLLAYEEAARLFELALDSMERSRASDAARRCEVLLGLGDALARGGDEAGAKRRFLQAADCARGVHRDDLLALAALGYAGRHAWGRAGDDSQLVPLLEAGVEAVGEGDSVLRARLLARLAGALRDSFDHRPREALAEKAVEIGRRLNDIPTLAYALDGRFGATWRPDHPPEQRLPLADEIVRLGETARDREIQLWGHVDRCTVFFELGELRSVAAAIAAVDSVAGELRQPGLRWFAAGMRATLALIEGRLDLADSLARTALDVGQRSRAADALSTYAGQMFQLRREDGRLDTVEALIDRAARDFVWYPLHRCARAVLHVETGREAQARAEFEALAVDEFASLPFDSYWVYNMSLLGELAAALRHDAGATVIYERLRPYARRNAFAPPEGCLGSVSRSLGLLADVMGLPDAAARHFEDALEHNRRMRARSWLAHTQQEFATFLLARGGTQEHQHAHGLLSEALEICGDIGMPVLEGRITALLDRPRELAATSRPEPGAESATISLEGEYWTIAYRGRAIRLRDSKGMRILSCLLTSPGRPQPSVDLERIDEADEAPAAHALAASDAGEHLDDEARRAYRARMLELRSAIDDARAAGGAARVGSLQEELDFLTAELSRAVGLGGRARKAGSVAERARVNVTRAVKTALQRIASADLELAAHLDATVRTGSVCVYSPDPRAPIEWIKAGR
ncbi:MAG TPA: AAA family ATPase [Candidatus Dormibacteraeota bacterium]